MHLYCTVRYLPRVGPPALLACSIPSCGDHERRTADAGSGIARADQVTTRCASVVPVPVLVSVPTPRPPLPLHDDDHERTTMTRHVLAKKKKGPPPACLPTCPAAAIGPVLPVPSYPILSYPIPCPGRVHIPRPSSLSLSLSSSIAPSIDPHRHPPRVPSIDTAPRGVVPTRVHVHCVCLLSAPCSLLLASCPLLSSLILSSRARAHIHIRIPCSLNSR